MIAVTQGGDAMKHASEELKNDREVILAAVTQYGYALEWASDELKHDEEVVLAAVAQDGGALVCVSEELKNYKELVLAAVTQLGDAIVDASKVLQNDLEVVQVAFMQLLTKRYNRSNPDSPYIDKVNFDDLGSFVCKLAVSKRVLVPSAIIHVASARGLHWDHGMSILIKQDSLVLESKDDATGLLPFMTFAGSSEERWKYDLNTLYEMIKKLPQTVRLHKTNEQRVNLKRDNGLARTDVYDSIKICKLN